jgi:hypothetical protein
LPPSQRPERRDPGPSRKRELAIVDRPGSDLASVDLPESIGGDLASVGLPELFRRANAGHEECLRLAVAAIREFIEVGRVLTEAKSRVKHGEWAGTVEANCTFGIRQAQKYMRVFENRAVIEDQMRSGNSHLENLDGVIGMLAVHRDIPKHSNDEAFRLFIYDRMPPGGIPCHGPGCLRCAFVTDHDRLWNQSIQEWWALKPLSEEEVKTGEKLYVMKWTLLVMGVIETSLGFGLVHDHIPVKQEMVARMMEPRRILREQGLIPGPILPSWVGPIPGEDAFLWNMAITAIKPGPDGTFKVPKGWKPRLPRTSCSVFRSAVNANEKECHDHSQSMSGMLDIVEAITEPGQLILDPIMGTGTTGVAALRLGRKFIGIEADKKMFKIAKRRLADEGGDE